MKVILLSGKAESGKTYHANIICEMLNNMGYIAVVVPLAKKLKEQAKMLGWDGKKDERGRTLLQKLSDPIKAYHGKDCYARWALQDAFEECVKKDTHNEGKYVLICDDVRMRDEIDFFDDFQKISVRIKRPGHVSSLSEEQLNDKTETALDDYNFDMEVINQGVPQYAEKECEKIVYNFIKKTF